MKIKVLFASTALMILAQSGVAQSQSSAGDKPILVTPENFARAELDLDFAGVVKNGGFGTSTIRAHLHRSTSRQLSAEPGIRSNPVAVFDLDAGPVTVTLPNAGKRFMSLQVINEDQYTYAVKYGAGSYTLDREGVSARAMS